MWQVDHPVFNREVLISHHRVYQISYLLDSSTSTKDCSVLGFLIDIDQQEVGSAHIQACLRFHLIDCLAMLYMYIAHIAEDTCDESETYVQRPW